MPRLCSESSRLYPGRSVRTRVRNLLKMGTHPNVAIPMSFSRKGPWKCARTLATQTGMTNQWLKDQEASLKLRPLKRSASCQRTVGEHLSASGGFITQLTCHAKAHMGDGGRSGNLSEPPGALARLWRGPACRVVWGGGEKDSPLPDSA
ncbi:MAG: hypothetical protein R6U40_00770 [Desulfobacterales bacterium]